MNEKLVHESRVNIRFNEVDVLGIVWHGHYIKYFEDGREDFGRKYGLGYMDFYRKGFLVPIVSIQCDYKRPLVYGDELTIRTIYEPSDAAKLIFHYFIYRNNEKELVAQGKSVQVFLSANDQQLQIINPPFFESWKLQNLG
jgi:acyl-CoA thioester hydrolase